MKKRKNKLSFGQQQQINKAHHKNEFFAKLRSLCIKLGVPQVYNVLGRDQLDYMYNLRCQSIRVVAAPGCTVPVDVIETAKKVVSKVIKAIKVPVGRNKSVELSVYECFTVYMTLMLFYEKLLKDDSSKGKLLIEAMAPFEATHDDDHLVAATLFSNSLRHIACFESDPRHKIYMMHHRVTCKYEGKLGLFGLLEIHSKVPETKNFIINGISRPAVSVCWGQYDPNPNFVHISLTPEQLNMNVQSKTLKFPVYIQSHAIQRLLERLDVIFPGYIFMSVNAALQFELKVSRDKSGNILIDMLLVGKKVGYLLADIADSSVVIRTFLFLTHNGTPEGDKLRELTGLEKEDKSYLEIDRLSTFLKSDIHLNEKLKDIFIQAGCESLFHLDPSTFDIHEKEKPRAEKILAYLGLDNVLMDSDCPSVDGSNEHRICNADAQDL